MRVDLSRVPYWCWLVAALVVILVVLILSFRPFMRQPLMTKLRVTILSLFWLIWCACYVFWWGLQTPLRRFLKESAAGVLFVASLYVVAELVLTGLRVISINTPQLFHLPVWADILLIVLAVLVVRHRWGEFKRERQQATVWPVVGELFREMATLKLGSDDVEEREAALEDFLDKFCESFKVILESGHRINVAITLMEPESGALHITYHYPESVEFDLTLSLVPGQGGAGYAYQVRDAIFIPSVRHQHGIQIHGTTYDLVPSVYVPSGKEPFRCILSVPVCIGSATPGVLSFSADKRNAFSPLDFEIAQMAASVLAMVLDRA